MLGVIGRNGAGKSTLLKILTRITTPTAGAIEIRGRVGSLLEVGTGFHPELTGRENVFLNGAILGMKRREIQGKFDEIVEFAGVEQFIDTPVKRYSSGMYVRLAFAVAAHLEPEILLVDEVLAVCSRPGVSLWGSFTPCLTGRVAMSLLTTRRESVALGRPDRGVRSRTPGDDLARFSRCGSSMMRGTPQTPPTFGGPSGSRSASASFIRTDRPSSRRSRSTTPGATSCSTHWTRARRWREPSSPGEYVSTAWIPGNLLNEGLITVDVGICSVGLPKLHPHAGCVDAVSFHVQDEGEGGLGEASSRAAAGCRAAAARMDDRRALRIR